MTSAFFPGFAATRARLALLAGAFVAATVGFVGPAWASLQSVSLGNQQGTLTYGTAGTATYTVTVNRSNGSPNAATMTVTGLPSAASYSFGTPSAWSSSTGNGSQTIPLTINTTAITAVGSTFTARAAASGSTTRTVTGTLLINKSAQTITFGALAGKTYLDPAFAVSAAASSDLPVSFTASPSTVCTVTGAVVTLTGAGSCTVTASQAGNINYLAATPVALSFTIAKASQTITFNQPPDRLVGDPDFAAVASASSGLPVGFAAAGDCTVVSGSTIHLTTPATLPGSCTLTASQAGNANFNAATSVPRTFAINAFSGTELWAVTGSAALPGQSVPVWGYSLTNAAVTAPGGPTLTVNQGDTVNIRLHNTLAVPTALLFQGQAMIPDTTGVAPGATKVYSFVASQPGTYLYEAGLLPNAQYQAAMGLHGALVVKPATAGQAYADVAGTPADEGALTAYDVESVLVLSELDPALNKSADKTTFDMRNFAPKFFLINGKAYPGTDPIAASTVANPSGAGSKVLLRYVNAGVKHHSMAVLGLRQNFVAKDGNLLPTLNHNVAAETLAPGQTADAIAAVPATVTTASRFALYDASLMLHNNGAAGFGGMLTFVTAGTGTGAGGPTTSGVTLNPAKTAGTASVALSAAVAGNGPNVTAAEYFIDTVGTNGTGTPMSGASGANATVTATIPAATLAGLAAGNHTVYVHGLAGTTWGAVSSAVLNLDKAGPASTGLTLTPNPSNGTVAVALHATGNDTATGGSNVTAAEYFIGTPGANGSGVPMTVNAAAPVASLDATINPPPVTGGLISVHARDELGNWGPFATITLSVTSTGPTTSVSVAPNPNNGTVPLSASQPVVRVTATMTSGGSTVAGAEGFIGAAGAAGTGFPFTPADGAWNAASETGYADIPLANIAALPNGNTTISVRARDAAGNWGAVATATLLIDRAAPTLSAATLSPNAIGAGQTVTLSVTATDTGGAGLAGGQYWIDGTATPPANPTAFTGTSVTIGTSGLAAGSHTVYVQVRDAAGNWSTVASATLSVIQAVNDSRPISANGSATQTSDASGNNSVLTNDQPTGTAGRTARLTSAPVRTSGTGAGTIAVSCPGSLGTAATPSVSGQTICTNGNYRVTLTGSGGNNNQRAASKRGTFTFTYTMTLNGASSTATVTITVN